MFEDEWFRGLEISTEGGRGERKLPSTKAEKMDGRGPREEVASKNTL